MMIVRRVWGFLVERWETVVITLSIFSLWPVVKWYNSRQNTPGYYHLVLLAVLAVLGVVTYRRVKRLREALRDLRGRRERGPFPPFF